MPDDLYWDDTLEWSERQSALLRRIAAGERVNDVDWEHVIEEIEDVGKTELRACTSLLRKAIEHLLKLHAWPVSASVPHWRGETLGFLADARLAFTRSMRQKIDLSDVYRRGLRDIRQITIDGEAPDELPDTCVFSIEELLGDEVDLDELLTKLARPKS